MAYVFEMNGSHKGGSAVFLTSFCFGHRLGQLCYHTVNYDWVSQAIYRFPLAPVPKKEAVQKALQPLDFSKYSQVTTLNLPPYSLV